MCYMGVYRCITHSKPEECVLSLNFIMYTHHHTCACSSANLQATMSLSITSLYTSCMSWSLVTDAPPSSSLLHLPPFLPPLLPRFLPPPHPSVSTLPILLFCHPPPPSASPPPFCLPPPSTTLLPPPPSDHGVPALPLPTVARLLPHYR